MIIYNKKIRIILLIYFIFIFFLYNNYQEELIENSIILPVGALLLSMLSNNTQQLQEQIPTQGPTLSQTILGPQTISGPQSRIKTSLNDYY